jgi:hypothetical protein
MTAADLHNFANPESGGLHCALFRDLSPLRWSIFGPQDRASRMTSSCTQVRV